MRQLSIIISVYKVEKYIREYMESVFRQGLADDQFELIIINDGTPRSQYGGGGRHHQCP